MAPDSHARCEAARRDHERASQRLKQALADRAPKTVNNVLTVLSTLLKKAVEWGELERLPCTIKLPPDPKKTRHILRPTFCSHLAMRGATGASNHGGFVSCVADTANGWKALGLISGNQKGKIQSCAAKSR